MTSSSADFWSRLSVGQVYVSDVPDYGPFYTTFHFHNVGVFFIFCFFGMTCEYATFSQNASRFGATTPAGCTIHMPQSTEHMPPCTQDFAFGHTQHLQQRTENLQECTEHLPHEESTCHLGREHLLLCTKHPPLRTQHALYNALLHITINTLRKDGYI